MEVILSKVKEWEVDGLNSFKVVYKHENGDCGFFGRSGEVLMNTFLVGGVRPMSNALLNIDTERDTPVIDLGEQVFVLQGVDRESDLFLNLLNYFKLEKKNKLLSKLGKNTISNKYPEILSELTKSSRPLINSLKTPIRKFTEISSFVTYWPTFWEFDGRHCIMYSKMNNEELIEIIGSVISPLGVKVVINN